VAKHAEVAKVAIGLRHVMLAGERLRSELAAQLHIGATELTALGHLATEAEHTPKELSALLGITTGSVTGVSDRLEAAGLIFRRTNPQDRRSVLLRLSPAGEHAMGWVEEQFHAAASEALGNGLSALAVDLAVFLDRAAVVFARAAARETDAVTAVQHA
jgi:DNA-binding MarR family transcriptional regulator